MYEMNWRIFPIKKIGTLNIRTDRNTWFKLLIYQQDSTSFSTFIQKPTECSRIATAGIYLNLSSPCKFPAIFFHRRTFQHLNLPRGTTIDRESSNTWRNPLIFRNSTRWLNRTSAKFILSASKFCDRI